MVRIKCTEDLKELKACIKVIGVGGAGGNAINRLIEAGIQDVDLIATNTDAQVLKQNASPIRIQIGENLTRGLGVGGDPAKGRMAALESRDQIREILVGANMVFITAGMGGGTGTGAAPVVAQVAKEVKALTVGVVSRPFAFEGRVRAAQAESGIQELRNSVDTLLVIPNDRIFDIIEDKTPHEEAFRRADDVLRQAIQSISDVITTAGVINVDFNDIQAIMANAGDTLMGTGEASGVNRTLNAAKRAIVSPLLENVAIEGAKGMIVNVTSSKSLPLAEIKEALEFINRSVSPEANVKYGHAYDDSLKDKVRITVIATGFPPLKTRPWFKGALRPSTENSVSRRAEGFREYASSFAEPRGQPASSPEDWARPAFLRWKLKKIK